MDWHMVSPDFNTNETSILAFNGDTVLGANAYTVQM